MELARVEDLWRSLLQNDDLDSVQQLSSCDGDFIKVELLLRILTREFARIKKRFAEQQSLVNQSLVLNSFLNFQDEGQMRVSHLKPKGDSLDETCIASKQGSKVSASSSETPTRTNNPDESLGNILSDIELDDSDIFSETATSPLLNKHKPMNRSFKKKLNITPPKAKSTKKDSLEDEFIIPCTPPAPAKAKKLVQKTLVDSSMRKKLKTKTVESVEPIDAVDLDETVFVLPKTSPKVPRKTKNRESQENSDFWAKREKAKQDKVPKFAYRQTAVRNKEERSKLPGWSCERCKDFYEDRNLSEEDLKKLMQKCSRHKNKFGIDYNTPAGFWDMDFPPTQASAKKTP